MLYQLSYACTEQTMALVEKNNVSLPFLKQKIQKMYSFCKHSFFRRRSDKIKVCFYFAPR